MNIFEAIIIAVISTLVGIITGISVRKDKKKSINNVHFYIARDKDEMLWLYMGKPRRGIDRFHPCKKGCLVKIEDDLVYFGLNLKDFENLKFEDEPIEVFLN